VRASATPFPAVKELPQSLIPPSLTMASTAASTPLNPGGDVLPIMVHVTAPATLPAGYTFEAELNGDPDKVFNCEVVRVLF
jgi:hypothetical protein